MITKFFKYLVFVLGMTSLIVSCQKKEQCSDLVRITRNVLSTEASLISKQNNLSNFGFSEAYKNGKIRKIGLDFKVKNKISKEQARFILADSINQLITHINECEDIQSYLPDGKITQKNVSICLFLQPNSKKADPTEYRIATCKNGQIEYLWRPEVQLEVKESETFVEALALLNELQNHENIQAEVVEN